MTTLIYTHSACLGHRPGTHHPESSERLLAVPEALEAPEFADVQWRNAPWACESKCSWCTHPNTSSVSRPCLRRKGFVRSTPVTSPGTLEAVMRCVGAACAAVDAVVGHDASMAADMLPALRRFGAELIIISAGFDAHHMDPLGGLNFTDDDYHWITRELMKVADESASGRVVSILEGGYSLEALATGTAAHVRALMGR